MNKILIFMNKKKKKWLHTIKYIIILKNIAK